MKSWWSKCICETQNHSLGVVMQVAFHLQTQEPPILPPLCELFQQSQDVLRGRPLHAGQQPQDGILEVLPLSSLRPPPPLWVDAGVVSMAQHSTLTTQLENRNGDRGQSSFGGGLGFYGLGSNPKPSASMQVGGWWGQCDQPHSILRCMQCAWTYLGPFAPQPATTADRC